MQNVSGNACVRYLTDLPVGAKAVVAGIVSGGRGSKKFADAGFVPGVELQIESYAPFGGLIRVKVLDTSMALHKDDASCIMLKSPEVVHA